MALPSVEIAVRDRGIGLGLEHHDLVFEKFYQVGTVALHSPGKTTFKGGGPGLGLALVRGVARAHGGKVWVESAGHDEVNFTGSTFYLMLRFAPAHDKNFMNIENNSPNSRKNQSIAWNHNASSRLPMIATVVEPSHPRICWMAS